VIFFDTSAIVGRIVQRDQYHQTSLAFWDSLAETGRLCFTSNLVLAEAITLIARRTSYAFAADQARELYSSKILTILRPELEDEIRAIHLPAKFADQGVSFVDCTSFAIMRRMGIDDVFGFDQHFSMAGFHLRP
jgi:predicted nucleic acid-binding protein